MPQGTPNFVAYGPLIVTCRCFFKSLSYFINKRYFVISTLCRRCPRLLAVVIPQPRVADLAWWPSPPPAGYQPSCLPALSTNHPLLLQDSGGGSGQGSLRLAAWEEGKGALPEEVSFGLGLGERQGAPPEAG